MVSVWVPRGKAAKEALSGVISSCTTWPRMGLEKDGGELRSRRRRERYLPRGGWEAAGFSDRRQDAVSGKEKDFIKP